MCIPGVIKPRRVRKTGNVVWMGEMKSVYRVLVGKPEGKRPLRKRRRRRDDNIKGNFRRVRKITKSDY
jgi:hypothetical protein